MIDNNYFQVSYPSGMFGDFVIWFINQHDNFFKPRAEFIPVGGGDSYRKSGNDQPFPDFGQRYDGNLVREGFPSFQEKTSDNPTILLIDEYYQMRLLPPDIKNPVRKKLLDIYNDGIMVEKLDELRAEFDMPDKIAFKNLWTLRSKPTDDVLGHMSLPYDGISMIYIIIEDLDSVWFDVYAERQKLWGFFSNDEDSGRQFPVQHNSGSVDDIIRSSAEYRTVNVDKLLNMETQEYRNLLDYIDEPPLKDWEEYILPFRTHLGVYLGET